MGRKFPKNVRGLYKIIKKNKPAQQELELHSNVIEVLSKVSPSEMIEGQQADPTISQVV